MNTANASSTPLTPRTGRPAHVRAFGYARSLSAIQAACSLSPMNGGAEFAASKLGHCWVDADRKKPGGESA